MRCYLLCLLLGLFAIAARGQQWEWNKNFGQEGIFSNPPKESGNNRFDMAEAIVELPDGKLLTSVFSAGYFLHRYHKDGTPDLSFGDGGYSKGYRIYGMRMFQLPDKKILLTGRANWPQLYIFVYRLLPDGNPDSSFGINGHTVVPITETSTTVLDAVTEPNGYTTLLVGTPNNLSSKAPTSLVRIAPDGNIDVGFGTNGIVAIAQSIESIPFGLVRSGQRLLAGFIINNQLTLSGHHSDGTPDKSFGEDGILKTNIKVATRVAHMTALADGRIMIGASVNSDKPYVYDYIVGRLLPNGAPDPSFNGTGFHTVPLGTGFGGSSKLLLDAAGNIYCLVQKSYYSSQIFLARLTPTGIRNEELGNLGFVAIDVISDFVVFNDAKLLVNGNIVLAGNSGLSDDEDFFHIVQVDHKGEPVLQFGESGTARGFTPTIRSSMGAAIPLSDGSLYTYYEGLGATRTSGILRIGADGAIQKNFGINGFLDTLMVRYDTLSQGRTITVQEENAPSSIREFLELHRYLSDGSLDKSFGQNGKKRTYVGAGLTITFFGVQADDKMLIEGYYLLPNFQKQFFLTRLLANGDIDKEFGEAGFVYFNEQIDFFSIRTSANGYILLGGILYNQNAPASEVIVRITPNGKWDLEFGDNGLLVNTSGIDASFVSRLIPQPGEYFLSLVGYEDTDKEPKKSLKRFDQKGRLTPEFGTNGEIKNIEGSVVLLNDGRIVAVYTGTGANAGMIKITTWLPDGRPDQRVGPGGVQYLAAPFSNSIWDAAVSLGNRIFIQGIQYMNQEIRAVLAAIVLKEPHALVSSFTLMDATTDKAVQVLEDGAVINIAAIRGQGINIRANTQPDTLGSVAMQLTGQHNRTITDNSAPYFLFGNTGSNVHRWLAAPGKYTLKATGYTDKNAQGNASTPRTISFTIEHQLTLSGLTLINARNNAAIRPLTDGAVIDLAQTPEINIRANQGTGFTESVRFAVNGNINFGLDNSTPFALAGDSQGDYGAWNIGPGTYTITATPYGANFGTGRAGTPLTITITIINSQLQQHLALVQQTDGAQINESDRQLSLTVFPNPLKQHGSALFRVPTNTYATLTLVDGSGRTIRQVFAGSADRGVVHRKDLKLATLPAGTYFLHLITAEGTTSVVKILKE